MRLTVQKVANLFYIKKHMISSLKKAAIFNTTLHCKLRLYICFSFGRQSAPGGNAPAGGGGSGGAMFEEEDDDLYS